MNNIIKINKNTLNRTMKNSSGLPNKGSITPNTKVYRERTIMKY